LFNTAPGDGCDTVPRYSRALTVAGASKAIFIALVLSHGGRFLGYQAGIAVFVDALWVIVFASYFLAVRRTPTGGLRVGSTVGTV
jgi:hypothetical protein